MLPSHRLVLSILFNYAITTAAAVSLADFAPRIDGPLPTRCNAVYNQQIDGCVANDFDSSKQRCSAACVSGLVKIMQAVTSSCSLDDVSETSIIGVFLLGSGIPILCKGVSVTTIGRSSSTPPPAPTSTAQTTISRQPAAQQSSSSVQQSSPVTSTSPAESTTATQAPPAGATPDPSFAWTLPSTVSPPDQRPTPNLQKSNSDSGGGSPFDIVASAASQPQRYGSTTLMGAVIGLAVLACTII